MNKCVKHFYNLSYLGFPLVGAHSIQFLLRLIASALSVVHTRSDLHSKRQQTGLCGFGYHSVLFTNLVILLVEWNLAIFIWFTRHPFGMEPYWTLNYELKFAPRNPVGGHFSGYLTKKYFNFMNELEMTIPFHCSWLYWHSSHQCSLRPWLMVTKYPNCQPCIREKIQGRMQKHIYIYICCENPWLSD